MFIDVPKIQREGGREGTCNTTKALVSFWERWLTHFNLFGIPKTISSTQQNYLMTTTSFMFSL